MVGDKISLLENLEILSTTGKFREISYSSESEEESIILTNGEITEKGENIVIQDEKGNRIEFSIDYLKEIMILEDKKIVDIRGIEDDVMVSTVFFFKEGEFEAYLERIKKAEIRKDLKE